MRNIIENACVRLFSESSKLLKPRWHRYILSAGDIDVGDGSANSITVLEMPVVCLRYQESISKKFGHILSGSRPTRTLTGGSCWRKTPGRRYPFCNYREHGTGRNAYTADRYDP